MSLFICLTQTCLSQPLDARAGSREERENGEEQIDDSHLERGECPRHRDTNQGLAPAAGGLTLHRQHKIGWKCAGKHSGSLCRRMLYLHAWQGVVSGFEGEVSNQVVYSHLKSVSRYCQIFASAGLSMGQGGLCVAVESPPHWKYFIGKRDFHISDREFPKHAILLLLNHPDSINDALFAKGCWALQLISLWFAKYPEYPRVCQMSQSARSVTFRCYKNRAIQQHQKGMHWQLWIEMFQHFIPREIHEDCLFTSTQNNISVLSENFSQSGISAFHHPGLPEAVRKSLYLYKLWKQKGHFSVYLLSFNKNNKVLRHHWRNHKTLTDRQCFTLKPDLMPNP